jgi:hypothetical protein
MKVLKILAAKIIFYVLIAVGIFGAIYYVIIKWDTSVFKLPDTSKAWDKVVSIIPTTGVHKTIDTPVKKISSGTRNIFQLADKHIVTVNKTHEKTIKKYSKDFSKLLKPKKSKKSSKQGWF